MFKSALCYPREQNSGEDQQLWSHTGLSLIYSSAIKGYAHFSFFIDFTKLISIEFVSMTLSIFPYFANLIGKKIISHCNFNLCLFKRNWQ